MRLWVMFDLHHHAAWPYIPPEVAPDSDVIVIAGDAGEELSRKVIPWIADTFRRYDLPILYVPGNHDFYKTNLSYEVRKAQLVAEHHGVHLLANGQSIVIGNTRFVGATLWTDYDLGQFGHFAETAGMRYMNDYRFIRAGAGYRKALPKDTIDEHYAQRERIERLLAEPFDGPTVVVTHHSPHERGLQHGRVETELDAAYASDLSELIERYKPEVWVHGHIHVNHDYVYDETRIICNPRGYLITRRMHGRGEFRPENPSFTPEMVIEVAPRPKPVVQPT